MITSSVNLVMYECVFLGGGVMFSVSGSVSWDGGVGNVDINGCLERLSNRENNTCPENHCSLKIELYSIHIWSAMNPLLEH